MLHVGSLLNVKVFCQLASGRYLEHQHEQQQCAGHDVHLTLPGQWLEVSEGVTRMLQELRPPQRGRGAATQVEPADGRRQRQFADAQEPPDGQQVGVALSEESHDAPHQEVEHQSQQEELRNRK